MKVDLSDEFATFGTDELVCPYCGEVQFDSWEHEADSGSAYCYECDRQFTYSRTVSVTYETKKDTP